ncbi:hypothetical protein, partial [Salimicrobium jeotgali]
AVDRRLTRYTTFLTSTERIHLTGSVTARSSNVFRIGEFGFVKGLEGEKNKTTSFHVEEKIELVFINTTMHRASTNNSLKKEQ